MSQFFTIQLFLFHLLLITSTHSATRSLNQNWKLTNQNKSIEIDGIKLPSGVYSELENAGLTESVLYSWNDVKLRWISKDNWVYSREFYVDENEFDHQQVFLTFHGLDTFASIFLNDIHLGDSENMFVTYRFDVTDKLKTERNTLRLFFDSAVLKAASQYEELGAYVPPECPPREYSGECHMNTIRKMQASFSWDWGLAAPSVGIWRNVELEYYDTAVIRDVIVNTEYVKERDVWKLFVQAHVDSDEKPVTGVLSVEILEIPSTKQTYNWLVGNQKLLESTAEIQGNLVEAWWPNGYGKQALYTLRVRWDDAQNNEVKKRGNKILHSEKTVRIGFRTVELVQDKMDNGLSFYFKINDIPMFMKGSNWIPAHILPEFSADVKKLTFLLQSAKDSHMNMLRVWGGGLYESDLFYDLADEMGILLWHDMMFACAMYRDDQEFLDSVRLETNQNIKRLQHHPSIAMWATNNENEVALRQNWYNTKANFSGFAASYRRLYVETIEDEIAKVDPFTPLLTSSPSNGAKPFTPEEQGIGLNPQDPHYGDIHYYNYAANGWDPNLYSQPRFSSEYGFQSYPSIRSWQTVVAEHDDFDKLLTHRQHSPLGNAPIEFLVKENLGVTGNTWDEKIYLSQVSQAMAIKTESEVYRKGRNKIFNTMGALYWQLNDVWVAPSWSSIEYTGHYKILYHWMKRVFAPKTMTVLFNKVHQVVLFGISDEIDATPEPHQITMSLYKWDSLQPEETRNWNFTIQPNSVVIAGTFDIYTHLTTLDLNVQEYLAEFKMFDSKNQEISREVIFPVLLRFAKNVKNPNIKLKIGSQTCEKDQARVPIEVSVDVPVLFVYLELMNMEVEEYQLSDNGFVQVEEKRTIYVTYKNPGCKLRLVPTDFKVMDVNRFLVK